MRGRTGIRPTSWTGRAAALFAVACALSNGGCGNNEGKPAASANAPAAAGEGKTQSLLLAAPLSPSSTLEETLAHPDPLERARRVAEILEASKPEEVHDLKGKFEAAELPSGDIDYALFISWWARFDPPAAMTYAFDRPFQMQHPMVLREAMRMWARQDPEAALASGWLNSLSIDMGGLDPIMVEAYVIGRFESGEPGLVDWIVSLDPTSTATALAAYMRMRVLRDGAKETLAWTQSPELPYELQRQFLAAGLNVVARAEPKTAIEFLDIAEKTGVDTRTFIARIGRGWATRDPKAAMEWLVSRQMDPNERWRAILDVAETWLRKDEKAVEEWLAPRAKEEWADLVRKQAIFYHVKKNRYRVDWLAQMKRASEFIDEDARRAEYLWLIQRWKTIDPEAGSAWLEKNKELLGDRLKYADQLWQNDRDEIEKVLAEEKAAAGRAATGTTAPTASQS